VLPPYERGYRLAIRARAALGRPHQPLFELGEVLHSFGVRLAPFEGSELFRSACSVGAGGSATVFYAEAHSTYGGVHPTRFAIAAALGRLLGAGAGRGPFGAAHGSQSAYRETQEANAFAAELLLPYAALVQQSLDVDALSDKYGISRVAAERHLSNRLP
jgi:hypothetical protein